MIGVYAFNGRTYFSLVVRLYTMFSPRIFLHQNPDSSLGFDPVFVMMDLRCTDVTIDNF